MLFDGQRRRFDIDLLDDARKRGIEPQSAAAAGAEIAFVGREKRDLLWRKRFACVRACMSWPGWPPMERFWPSRRSGGFGLTMSEEGGLDEVAEFFLAAASCSWRRATVASSAFNRAS